ncbi:MAG: hypothetical protein ABL949_01245 [Fimbriimonadaceae bacterium]
MPSNNYWNLTNAEAQALATQINAAMNLSPSTFGASAGQLTALLASAASVGTDAATAAAAKNAAKVAFDNLAASRKALNANIAILAKQMYAKPLSDAQVQSTGLQPRDKGRTPHNPITPTLFVATPNADGSVVFAWNRSGNTSGAVFVIEASVEGGPWNAVFSTKRTKVSVSGFAPGVETATRVRATNRGLASQPSFEQVIYPATNSQTSSLKLAA